MLLNENLFENSSFNIIRKFGKRWFEDKNTYDIVSVETKDGKKLTLGQKIGDDYVTGFDPESNTVYLNEDPNVDGGRDYSVDDILNESVSPNNAMKSSVNEDKDSFINKPKHLQTYEFDRDGEHISVQYDAKDKTYGYQKSKDGKSEMGNIDPKYIKKFLEK